MTQFLLWAQSNQLLSIFLSFAVIYILREIFLKVTIRRPFIYYCFLFPGIILHELSHLVICLITLTKVRDIKLFSKSGGFVEHEKSKIPFVGNFLISVAPLLVGSIGIYYLSGQIPNSIGQIVSSPKSIIIFYFLISILITFFPSRQDVHNTPLLYAIAIVVLGFAVAKFNLTFAFTVFELTSISAIIALIAGIIIIYVVNKLIWK